MTALLILAALAGLGLTGWAFLAYFRAERDHDDEANRDDEEPRK